MTRRRPRPTPRAGPRPALAPVQVTAAITPTTANTAMPASADPTGADGAPIPTAAANDDEQDRAYRSAAPDLSCAPNSVDGRGPCATPAPCRRPHHRPPPAGPSCGATITTATSSADAQARPRPRPYAAQRTHILSLATIRVHARKSVTPTSKHQDPARLLTQAVRNKTRPDRAGRGALAWSDGARWKGGTSAEWPWPWPWPLPRPARRLSASPRPGSRW